MKRELFLQSPLLVCVACLFRSWAMHTFESHVTQRHVFGELRVNHRSIDKQFYVPSPAVSTWQSNGYMDRESFIKRLPYPEYVQFDLESAIAMSAVA